MGLGYDDTIDYAKVVSVSTSCSRCSSLAVSLTASSCILTHRLYRLHAISLWTIYIYSIDTILYPYALPSIHSP